MKHKIPDQVRDFLAQPTRMFIGGDFVEATNGATIKSYNPATGKVLTEIPDASASDVDAAVSAAAEAFAGPWRTTPPAERAELLWRLAMLIEQNADMLATLETLDNGKPLEYAKRDDIPSAVAVLKYFSGWATKIHGDVVPQSAGADFVNIVHREPRGVVAAIVPWNYPLVMAVAKISPALATGNTVVLKPAEQTSLSALFLARLAREAGFPSGVFNVITGVGEGAGRALSSHSGIGLVTFTGSTSVGKEIMRNSAERTAPVILELGGKSPNIIFEDADLDAAIEGASNAIFYNMGQDCSAGSRLLVHESIADAVVDGLTRHASARRIGDGMLSGVDQGPLVSSEQRDRVLGYIRRGVADGAELATGGGEFEAESGGYFVQPTVIVGAPSQSSVVREEIFGPVLVVQTFSSDEEALHIGNDTPYGLGAGVWTSNVSRALRMSRDLRAGTVWINCYNVNDAASPFGGYKASGFGKDFGRQSLESYVQNKSVWFAMT